MYSGHRNSQYQI